MTPAPAIAFNDVCKSYDEGRAPVLDHVSLSVGEREFVAVVGPSGSGKTTMLMAIAGFVMPSLWIPAAIIFVIGWALQFVGHYFEGEPPEFFKDWRFLFVGLRWWLAKLQGRV